MAALDFPASPTGGQQYNAPNGAVYTWDGAAWVVSGVLSTGSAAGGDLSGTYPNPQVVALAPYSSLRGTATAMLFGQTSGSSTRLRIENDPAGHAYLQENYSYAPDDTTKASWSMDLSAAADAVMVNRRAPNAAASGGTNLLTVAGSDGKTYCTLADLSVTVGMLAGGAATRQNRQTQMTANYNNVTLNTWVAIAATSSMTTRTGGLVFCFAVFGGFITVNPAGGSIYFRISRDNQTAQVCSFRYDVKSPTTANTNMISPTILFWDAPPAGAHTWEMGMYQTGNALFGGANDQQGWIQVMEMA